MRTVLSLAVVFGLVAGSSAQEPPKVTPVIAPTVDLPKITGTVPQVVLAKAATKDGKVVVTVKLAEQICFPETQTVSMDVVKRVDGKDVTEKVTKAVTVTVCKTQWKVVEIPMGQPGVSVTDGTGKAVSQDDVLKRLEKETAILRAMGGPADPFYLQTTKPETLVLVTPLPPPQPAAPVMPAPVPVPPKK